MDTLLKANIHAALSWSATYCAILILLGFFLAIRVIAVRRSKQIGLGDGGDRDLNRRIRAHGNFSEFAPLLMVILVLLPLLGAKPLEVHCVGIPAIIGRLMHAFALSSSGGSSFGRVGGMVLTFTSIIIGVGMLLTFAWIKG